VSISSVPILVPLYEDNDANPGFPIHDPLSYSFPLGLTGRYYPVGFPVEITTNSRAVLNAAESLWSRYQQLSDQEAVRLHVMVHTHDAEVPVRPALPRGQQHLISIVHGEENFAVADLATGFAFAALTRNVAADRSYFSYYFLEPLVYVMLAARHFTFVHAASIALNGQALLLCGESGGGKTCLAFECARRGWSFISGDATHIVRDRYDYTVIGRPYQIRFRASARSLFPELESYEPELRPNGKTDIEVNTEDFDLSTALTSRATHIVFLERASGTEEARIEPFSTAEAARQLVQTICFGDDRIRAEQRRALMHFLTLPVYRLRYSDLAHAERALRSLVTEIP
jgi:hypothetical protein